MTHQAGRITIADLSGRKARGEPIVMITAYDYPSARIAEEAGVDIVLVGDSAAMTVLGYTSTRQVTTDELLVLTRAVRRGLARPLLVGDLTFGTYEESDDQALASARRFVDAGCDAVKLEGAGPMIDRVRALVAAGIPVMGHVGLTPQQVIVAADYKVRGRTAAAAAAIARDARALERAGCFAIVFEAVPAALTALVAPRLAIPVIGIGAGPAADGQVLVWHDLLGITEGKLPRFVERYGDLRAAALDAVRRYAADVRERRYPAPRHTYGIDAAEVVALETMLANE